MSVKIGFLSLRSRAYISLIFLHITYPVVIQLSIQVYTNKQSPFIYTVKLIQSVYPLGKFLRSSLSHWVITIFTLISYPILGHLAYLTTMSIRGSLESDVHCSPSLGPFYWLLVTWKYIDETWYKKKQYIIMQLYFS